MALVATLSLSGVGFTSVGCTWDFGGSAQAMTSLQLQSNGSGGSVFIFGLVSPASGAKTLRCIWSGGAATDAFVDAVSFTGVNQSGGTTSFPNAANATGGTGVAPSLTVTVPTGGAAVEITATTVSTAVTNQTVLFNDHTHGSVINAAASYEVGGGSITFTYSVSGATWSTVGTALAPP